VMIALLGETEELLLVLVLLFLALVVIVLLVPQQYSPAREEPVVPSPTLSSPTLASGVVRTKLKSGAASPRVETAWCARTWGWLLRALQAAKEVAAGW